MEFFSAVSDLDTVYVPIGQGSGICACAAVRNGLNLKTKIVGVVAEGAPAYGLSFEARRKIAAPVTTLLADGMACRVPDEDSLAIILRNVHHIVRVTEDEIRQAMKIFFTDTHNVAEGAGAVGLAAALKEKSQLAGSAWDLCSAAGMSITTCSRGSYATRSRSEQVLGPILIEPFACQSRQLREKRLVRCSEVKARQALHPLLQSRRHKLYQMRMDVERHQVIAHIGFSLLYRAERHWPTLPTVRFRNYQVLTGFVGNYFQRRRKLGEYFLELNKYGFEIRRTGIIRFRFRFLAN